MKKVLIISYYWPPAGGPGSIRIVKFAKYLVDYGWQPIILTVKDGEFPYLDSSLENYSLQNIKVYRTRSLDPFSFYKKITGKKIDEAIPVGYLAQKNKNIIEKIASSIRANLFIPDARIGWVPFAIREASHIIREEKINLLFLSSPPHSSQLIGLFLKRKYKIPFIADLRDPWTKIRYYENMSRLKISQKFDAYLEKKILINSDKITTVSKSLAASFDSLTGSIRFQKFVVLPNGFDESDFNDVTVKPDHTFKIIYTGNMQDNQNPYLLWQIVRNLINRNSHLKEILRIKLIGRVHPEIKNTISKYRLTDIIEYESFKPHSEIIPELISASILFMVIPKVKNNLGIVTGKFFEYLGANRPVLVIGPAKSDVSEILQPIQGSKLIDYEDKTSLEHYLTSTLKKWQAGTLNFDNVEKIRHFSRKFLTKRLAEIFDTFIS